MRVGSDTSRVRVEVESRRKDIETLLLILSARRFAPAPLTPSHLVNCIIAQRVEPDLRVVDRKAAEAALYREVHGLARRDLSVEVVLEQEYDRLDAR